MALLPAGHPWQAKEALLTRLRTGCCSSLTAFNSRPPYVLTNLQAVALLPADHAWQANGPLLTGLRTGYCGSLTTFSAWQLQELLLFIGGRGREGGQWAQVGIVWKFLNMMGSAHLGKGGSCRSSCRSLATVAAREAGEQV